LAALTAAILTAPAILIVQAIRGVPIDVWPLAVGAVVIALCVVGRMKVAIDQISTANRQRMEAQAALVYQAAHDPLTGLSNRAQALQLLTRALSRASRTDATIALLYLDLDEFKRINDTFGHNAGDDVLRAVAERLRETIRVGDVACRLGGDEFVILLQNLPDPVDALRLAERLVPIVSAPIVVTGPHTVTVGACVGVAFSGDSGIDDPDVLLQEADAALYQAKRSGRGRVEVFDADMRQDVLARAELERDLSEAIKENQLVLHYQPIVHLASGAVQGYEALVRWPRRGALMPPSDFVPLAEKSELICDLGAWALRQATQQLADWNMRTGNRRLMVSVNISGRHVSQPRILTDVRAPVLAAEIDPRQLVLEITETALTVDSRAAKHLAELREDGIAVSIDDFGTGYSSIARLEHLPIDILKIDKHFLDRSSRSSERLLRMIVDTGQALGLALIAEGVESEEQADLLMSIGCKSAQGYFLGRPLDPAAIGTPELGSAPRLGEVAAQGAPSEVQRPVGGPSAGPASYSEGGGP
jgi:diguanylate cyclase (GGDEF)-like protein